MIAYSEYIVSYPRLVLGLSFFESLRTAPFFFITENEEMESHGKPNGHVAAGENLASFQPKDAMTTPWGRGGLHEDQVWTYGFVASLRRPLRSVLRCLATDQALEKLTNKATTEVFFVGSLSSVSGFQNKLKKNCVLRTACSFADFRSGYD